MPNRIAPAPPRVGQFGKNSTTKKTKFRIITIAKRADYQKEENVQHQIVNTLSAGQQHAVTYKNDKNVKNEKKGTHSSFSSLSFEQQDIRRPRRPTPTP
ncbi:MAG: hypothetical protein L0Y36_03465 [Planctomycetales bacterium]|nr:hypothetical protein [Planctomycetales bacterium]